jgi:guanylate kinase
MTRGVAQGMFIEHATVHGNMYGTSKIAIETILERNRIPLLDIDVEGVKKIKGIGFDAKYVFLAPPSLAALESRLVGRKSETLEQIRTRLGNAKEEILYGTDANFDFVLVNDDLDLATERLVERLHLWFPLFFPKLHS